MRPDVPEEEFDRPLRRRRERGAGRLPLRRAGERGSAKVAGFDFGNSPTEILAAEVPPGSTVVLSTTNGTRVIEAARGAPAILTGAFVNADSLADELAAGIHGPHVVLVGCGWEGRPAPEGVAAAG